MLKESIKVSIATGRPLNISKPIIRELGITGLCSVHDSTQFYDPTKDEITDVVTLPKEKAEEVVKVTFKDNQSIRIGIKDDEIVHTGGRLPDEVCDIAVPDLPEEIVDSYIEKFLK